MITNIKQAPRMWSVQLTAIAATVATLEAFLPALEGKVPAWVYACLSIAIIVARLSRQKHLTNETLQELQRIKLIAKKGGLISLVVLLVGCVPGRGPCRAEADARFNGAVESCAGQTYDECPELREAERRQDEEYDRCP
jgi:hypothetical protein